MQANVDVTERSRLLVRTEAQSAVGNIFLVTDPILHLALDLIRRLNEGEVVQVEAERRRILACFYRGNAKCGNSEPWILASYALAAWIDEMLVDLPWDGASWWRNNILEVELFNSRECGKKFFKYANDALQLVDRSALSVFRDCVVLGFRGMYDTPEQAKLLSDEIGVPPTLDAWLVFMNQACEELKETAPVFPQQAEISGAAPQALRGPVLWWAIATTAALATNAVVFFS